MAGFEDAIAQNFVNQNKEKSFTDKILARNEIEQMRMLIKKEKLTRSEISELLYLCTSAESKLYNFSEWERYVILKYFAWLREFAQIAEGVFKNKEIMDAKELAGKGGLSDRGKNLLNNAIEIAEQITKFNVDVYLNIARTSLSQKGVTIMEILNNKFEISYPQLNQQPVVEKKQGIFQKITGG